MDISEKYIEMCEKAGEIQYLEFENIGTKTENLKSQLIKNGKLNIWLPRQDQLQEMIVQYYKTKRFTTDITSVFLSVAQWVYNSFGDDKTHPYTKKILGRKLSSDEFLSKYNKISLTRYSPEMIYLSYFMLVAHNKTWNGENWI